MAEPSEGVYKILCVGSQKAIDVVKDNDKSGQNVVQRTSDSSDGQIWAFDKQSDGWQIKNSLTDKCLDIDKDKVANGANVQQYSDNNKRDQRWVVQTDGSTYTYGGVAYPRYVISPSAKTSLNLAVKGNSNANDANIIVANDSTNTHQRWILIPRGALTAWGTYEIVLAADPKMCIEVAGGSTANGANIQVYTRNGTDSQIFRASINSETFVSVFYNAKTEKCLEIKGGTAKNGANVQQGKYTGDDSQKWLPVKLGTCKINGQSVPTYEIRSQSGTNFTMDCKGGGKKAKTNIQVWTRNTSSLAQRFAFVKTERFVSKIATPGAISNTLFTRDGPGVVALSGLMFGSSLTDFQARYMIKRYGKNRALISTTNWMNVKDNAAAREGWGDAWTKTFSNAPVNKVVTIPKTINITLDTEDCVAADVIFEIRGFDSNYNKSGFKAHGGSKSTTVKVRQKPKFSLKSMSISAESNKAGVRVILTDSLGEGCTRIRGRLVGEDGRPISEFVSKTELSVPFDLGGTLYRFPNQNEKVTFEYMILLKDNVNISGSIVEEFDYGSTTPDFPLTIVPTTDGSYGVLVTAPKHNSDACVFVTQTFDGKRLVPCVLDSETDNTVTYRCFPPLNRDVGVYIYSSNASGQVLFGYDIVNVKSHTFIWNWPSVANIGRITNFASIIVNSDAPPEQTRTFTSTVNYSSPAGRVLPVGFASLAVTADLSVGGVAIDEGASYQSAEPIPPHCSVSHIMQLVRLGGKGIHPIYRTPYGDWYWVGIESVDVSKTELNYSAVRITQHAVED